LEKQKKKANSGVVSDPEIIRKLGIEKEKEKEKTKTTKIEP